MVHKRRGFGLEFPSTPHVSGRIRQSRYKEEHDIYSLGVLLYEIGVWGSVEDQIGVPAKTVPEDFRKSLIEKCGELEWRIVSRCGG